MNGKNIIFVLATKAAAILLLWAVAVHNGGVNPKEFRTKWIRWPEEGEPVFLSQMTGMDSAHYLHLAAHGYSRGEQSCAFYPLWPMLVRACSLLPAFSRDANVNRLWWGMGLSNMFSLIGVLLFGHVVAHKLLSDNRWECVEAEGCRTERIDSIVRWCVVVLMLYPGAIFYQLPYSESLFFLLLMVLQYALCTGKKGLACCVGYLLPLCRGPGIFCVVPLVWRYWMRRDHSLLVVASLFIGWVSYFVAMLLMTGNAFEGFEAQRFLGVQSLGNLFDVPSFIKSLLAPTHWHNFTGSILDRMVFIVGASLLPVLWSRDKEWFFWALALGFAPALSGHFVSLVRFGAVVFPVFLAGGWYIVTVRHWSAKVWLVATFATIYVVLLVRQLRYEWAG